jgi:hypothetical protein
MKIQPLIVFALVASALLPQTFGQVNAVVTDDQLLASAVISQDAPTEDKADAAAEAFKLFKNDPAGLEINGWMAIGNGAMADHHILTVSLNPGVTGLNQLGISMDKAGDKFRFHLDVLYGRDAGLFQSNNNAGNGWDNSAGFQHGGGHAMALPQAFAETTAGDWTIKAGHFLANGPSGQYSTDRFFATRTQAEHAYSPITLTGVTGRRKIGETDVTIGWVAGTNTGFDNMSTAEKNGTFVLGLERSLGDKLSFTYNALFGDMSRVNIPLEPFFQEQAYHHNLTLNYETSERLSVAFTHVYSAWPSDDSTVSVLRQTAYYVVSDHITLGQRYENTSTSFGFAAESLSIGVNYQNTRWSNVLLRPEIRWENVNGDSSTDFFMDVVVTF